MDYLLVKLAWYIAAAFVVGLLLGWFACGRTKSKT